MFAVELDRENLEYDVHSLVQAFYPGEQVRVLIPESSAEKRAQLQDKVRIRVRMDRSGAKVTIDGREYLLAKANQAILEAEKLDASKYDPAAYANLMELKKLLADAEIGRAHV